MAFGLSVPEALESRGFQTAWFNAWHSQSEEFLFASLLVSLRGKALPSWWTPRGFRARERLFVARCGRIWLQLLLGLVRGIIVATVTSMPNGPRFLLFGPDLASLSSRIERDSVYTIRDAAKDARHQLPDDRSPRLGCVSCPVAPSQLGIGGLQVP